MSAARSPAKCKWIGYKFIAEVVVHRDKDDIDTRMAEHEAKVSVVDDRAHDKENTVTPMAGHEAASVPVVGDNVHDKENTDTPIAGHEVALVPVVDDKNHRWPPAAVEVASSVGVGIRSFTSVRYKGSYGRVYKAMHSMSGTFVAIKVVELDGRLASFEKRELTILKKLHGHPNIVCLHHVIIGMFTLELVFEYCDTTLNEVIKKRRFGAGFRQLATRQLFEGLRFIHSHWILHRDVKLTNLLIVYDSTAASPAQFCLKLADFGLGRKVSALGDEDSAEDDDSAGDDDSFDGPLSGAVFTRPYRPIEVLMGSRTYGGAADIWAAGCVCGEMCLGEPLFPGQTSSEMIVLILKEVDIPSSRSWPAFEEMPRFDQVTEAAPRIRQHISKYGWYTIARQCGAAIGAKYFNLLRGTLEPVPIIRWTAYQACSADLE